VRQTNGVFVAFTPYSMNEAQVDMVIAWGVLFIAEKIMVWVVKHE